MSREKILLNDEVRDALSEIGNICIGRTSVAVGKILGMRVYIDPPIVLVGGNELMWKFNDSSDEVAVGLLLSIHDSLEGMMLFIINKFFVLTALEKMTGNKYEDLSFIDNEEGFSAMNELANIMAASYMEEIGNYTGKKIFLSPIMVGVDMVGALVSFPLASLTLSGKEIICVDAHFSIEEFQGAGGREAGRIIMIHDEDSVASLASALGL